MLPKIVGKELFKAFNLRFGIPRKKWFLWIFCKIVDFWRFWGPQTMLVGYGLTNHIELLVCVLWRDLNDSLSVVESIGSFMGANCVRARRNIFLAGPKKAMVARDAL